ncbi:MAG: SusC/RagA family TonB-linked outer membrane protein [Mucilaginibacter sp.]|nr:SusC/RagA family TonB-linked outer membrane protein [Mucilaginibacter sp.]
MMRNFYSRILFVFFLLIFSGALYAQENIQVRGTVSDTLSHPIQGATVAVSGSAKIGAITDKEGNYAITVKSNATLIFSSVGFIKVTVDVNGQKVLNVHLKEFVTQSEEIVVTAFGRKQLKEAVVGSVTTINPKELKIPASNLTTALAGRVAGLISFQGNGQPGQDNAQFFIRGVTTFGYKQDPLILIDNVELTSSDLARLQVDDIESFSILKDASATALYGARGANGVILVTTKKGKLGKATLNFRLENSISAPTKTLEIADPITYMKLYDEAQTTRNPLAVPRYDQNKIYNTEAALRGDPGSNPYVYPAVNWLDKLFNKNATTQRANLSVSGGGAVATYYVSGSVNVDNGILKTENKNPTEKNNVKLQNYQLRSNVEINLTKTTKVSVMLWGNFTDYGGPISGSGLATDLYYKALHTNPVLFPASFPAVGDYADATHILFGNYPGGSANSVNYVNPYADLLKGFQTYSESRMSAQAELNQNFSWITPGLSFQGLFSTNRYAYFDYTRQYNPFYYTAPTNLYDPQSGAYSLLWINQQTGDGRATEYLNYSPGQSNITTFVLLRGILNYNRTFGKHTISSALALVRQQTLNPNAQNPVTHQPDLQYTLPYRNLNYTGRLSYSYMNKYFVEANAAYNGSERFSENNRFGLFPTIGASWVVSNEGFWKGGFTDIISRLKFRGSYGLVGNDNIGSQRFFYLSNVNLNGGNPAWFGYNNTNYRGGASVISYPNPDVTWERSKQTNLAVEATLFNDLNITAEIYKQHRYDILMPRTSIPSSVGLENQGSSPIAANIGVAESKGLDLNLNYKRTFNNFWLSALGNLTVTSSKYLSFEEPQYKEPWRYKTGQPINQFYGFIAERLFVDDKEAAASPTQLFESYGVAPKGGDIKYRDVNGDGIISERDMVPIGLPTTPAITYGFGVSAGYKNFDLSLFFNGNARVSFFINPLETSPFVGETQLLKGYADSHWSEQNQDLYALYPRLGTDWGTLSNNTRASTWWLRDGSFIRLKSVEFGYSLPKDIVKRLKMSNMRIYFSGLNLLTFSSFRLWDPELGSNGFNYPIQKVFNIGLNVNF